jgi:hypothetical protein
MCAIPSTVCIPRWCRNAGVSSWLVASLLLPLSFFGYLSAMIDALVLSLTPFHGRAFFPGLGSEATLYNPLVVLVAEEAVIGHFIEISYVGKFAQR